MKKILVLTTGGTLASAPGPRGLAPALDGAALLSFIPEAAAVAELSCRELFSSDSSDLQPRAWQTMARATWDALKEYDGIVITHGTDTLAYTAAALSFMLIAIKKPVVLTGSQMPIAAPGSDGPGNLLAAVQVAASPLAGVYVVFDGKIIPGHCAKKIYSKNLAAFAAVDQPLADRIEKGRVSLASLPSLSSAPPRLETALNERVLLLKLYPGFDPALLGMASNLGYRAVVLEAYGLGGLPCRGRSLLPALRKLQEAGIPVIITTQCLYDGCDLSCYEVGQMARSVGAISGGKLTSEALIAKLMCLLGRGLGREELVAALQEDQ